MLDEQFELSAKPCPRLTRDLEPRAVRPNRRINHDKIGMAKIFFAMAPEMQGSDRHIGQPWQCIGQCVFVGQIGHCDDGPLPCQPSRGSHPAAEMAQPHDRYTLAVVFHTSSKSAQRCIDKGVTHQAQATSADPRRWELDR